MAYYTTEEVRKMLTGETPVRKCRTCVGAGVVRYLECWNSCGLAGFVEIIPGQIPVAPENTIEAYEGQEQCEICGGLGHVPE